jgi:hypothetical protein
MIKTFKEDQIAKTTLDFALGILIMANTGHSAPHLENREHQVTTLSGKKVRILSVEHAKIVSCAATNRQDLEMRGSRMFTRLLRPDDEELWFPAHIHCNVSQTMNGEGNHYVLEKGSLFHNAISICDSLRDSHSLTTQNLAEWLSIHIRTVSTQQYQWTHTHDTTVPQQNNGTDCGVCVICTVSNELLGTPNTLATVKQIRKTIPLLILALSYDKLTQTATHHLTDSTPPSFMPVPKSTSSYNSDNI